MYRTHTDETRGADRGRPPSAPDTAAVSPPDLDGTLDALGCRRPGRPRRVIETVPAPPFHDIATAVRSIPATERPAARDRAHQTARGYRLNGSESAVFTLILEMIRWQKGCCFLSRNDIAQKLGYRIDTIKRALKVLERLGLIVAFRYPQQVARMKHLSNHYTIPAMAGLGAGNQFRAPSLGDKNPPGLGDNNHPQPLKCPVVTETPKAPGGGEEVASPKGFSGKKVQRARRSKSLNDEMSHAVEKHQFEIIDRLADAIRDLASMPVGRGGISTADWIDGAVRTIKADAPTEDEQECMAKAAASFAETPCQFRPHANGFRVVLRNLRSMTERKNRARKEREAAEQQHARAAEEAAATKAQIAQLKARLPATIENIEASLRTASPDDPRIVSRNCSGRWKNVPVDFPGLPAADEYGVNWAAIWAGHTFGIEAAQAIVDIMKLETMLRQQDRVFDHEWRENLRRLEVVTELTISATWPQAPQQKGHSK